ncbi:DUF982 domain-containing protein [Mesorhizobium liriopis]|uniref:DUF982 domain-containing protein n=1 Tax=Mesorhizobium liriopis TaxID=2953882 RepID=UPI00338E2D09
MFSTAPSNVCLINNADEAWNFLVAHWPLNATDEWLDAMTYCHLANPGHLANKQARASFVNAIRLAGMTVDQSHYRF